METNQRVLSLEETAQRMRSTKLNVLMHLKRGHLAGEEKNGQWTISESSLTRFLESDEASRDSVICQQHCKSRHCGSCS